LQFSALFKPLPSNTIRQALNAPTPPNPKPHKIPQAKRHVASGGNVDPLNSIGRTPLHLAALNGPARIIGFLLDLGADPTIKDDAGKVPYALSRGKEERDAFRRYMGEHPQRWDYNAAAVPSALTSEMEEEQERRAAEKKEKVGNGMDALSHTDESMRHV